MERFEARPKPRIGDGVVGYCMQTNQVGGGGLRVLHLQNMNMALLTKWVARIMGSQEDLTISILRPNYGKGLNWDTQLSSIRGVS